MAELYVKPGNRQRGWNDPPEFSYGLQQRSAVSSGLTQRGPFRRRVAAAAAAAAAAASEGKEPETVPHPRIASSPVGLLVPQSVNLPPPAPPTSFQRADAITPSVVETDKEYEIEDVLCSLYEALNKCRSFVQKQVCDDIHKRLVILQEMWTQGKLSSPVRKRMGILTEELKSQHWDEADEIHRSLMVDHVAEVSQWMVGVKRLIAETKNLPGGDLLQ
ncbi:steroid receptor RNA activator 1 [Erythrolamprus reginae]|uniref:steroid receptor RNA activator 1 n=1 Tax=Erythrolamprus reginae TaxID=121349 RepID=UPI00396CC995